MDYELMWKSMKSTYEERLNKLESEGKKGSTAWINAKRFVDVMTKFELVQQENTLNTESDGMDDYHFKRFKEQND